MQKIQSIRGFRDILPGHSQLFRFVEQSFHRVMALYNYQEIRIPVVEKTELFLKSIGQETDIVKKEMYSFEMGDGESLSLRPEGTAGVVRAYIQHSMSSKQSVTKLYYIGPMFRHERPQRSRYRQFYQAGVEVFGAKEPLADIELILMLDRFFKEIEVEDVTFICNHLGTAESRRRYITEIIEHFKGRLSLLCEDCVRRLEVNPLRLLDCKKEGCRDVVETAPLMEDYLPAGSRDSLDYFVDVIRDRGINIRKEPRLVRGLDYYTSIVFEGVVGGSSAIVGGGRYDELVGSFGGSSIPATGFAIGMERLIEVAGFSCSSNPLVFLVFVGDDVQKIVFDLMERLRSSGVACDFDPRGGSLKSQMKRADKAGSTLTIIVGEDEVREGKVMIKDMSNGKQWEVKLGDIVSAVRQRIEAFEVKN